MLQFFAARFKPSSVMCVSPWLDIPKNAASAILEEANLINHAFSLDEALNS